MAKKTNSPVYSLMSYPRSFDRDGVDVSEVVEHSGAMENAIRMPKDHCDWRDSETGMPTEKPEYASRRRF